MSSEHFGLPAFEESLGHCIIPAVFLSAHGHGKAMSRKELPARFRTILTVTIGMMDAAWWCG
ncbi:MAG: hypothetical protein ABF459_11195 [Gluconobacter cerinus]